MASKRALTMRVFDIGDHRVVVEIDVDEGGLYSMARKAFRNKGRKSVDGPVTMVVVNVDGQEV